MSASPTPVSSRERLIPMLKQQRIAYSQASQIVRIDELTQWGTGAPNCQISSFAILFESRKQGFGLHGSPFCLAK
jgi:hypothetical protein